MSVSIGLALGIASYFQFGHRSLTHHDFYLSVIFGIGTAALWAAIRSSPEGD